MPDSIPIVLSLRFDTYNRQQRKRSIRLEFTAPRQGSLQSNQNHDGVRCTMWMTPGQVEQWEKEHGKPLAVGTAFALALNPTTTGDDNASNKESITELPETRA